MWLLPSRGRPQLIARVFSKTVTTEPGVVGIDEDEVDLYSDVALPRRWIFHVCPRLYLGPKLNYLVGQFPGRPWYGNINDDMLPETQGWDGLLPQAAGRRGIAWADDGLNRRLGAAAYGGELIRDLGWLACPALKHFYIDDVHELIAAELAVGTLCRDIRIAHLHWSAGLTPRDRTTNERPPSDADRHAFEAWRVAAWPTVRERLRNGAS